jgi:hypothetical protein
VRYQRVTLNPDAHVSDPIRKHIRTYTDSGHASRRCVLRGAPERPPGATLRRTLPDWAKSVTGGSGVCRTTARGLDGRERHAGTRRVATITTKSSYLDTFRRLDSNQDHPTPKIGALPITLRRIAVTSCCQWRASTVLRSASIQGTGFLELAQGTTRPSPPPPSLRSCGRGWRSSGPGPASSRGSRCRCSSLWSWGCGA